MCDLTTGGRGWGKQGDTRNLLVIMDMFITLFVVMVSQVYAYVQTY